MPWLQYEILEVDPQKQAEWEAANQQKAAEEQAAKDAGNSSSTSSSSKSSSSKSSSNGDDNPPPEPELRTHAVEFQGEARLTMGMLGGTFSNLSVAPNGVTKIEILDEPPEDAVLVQTGDSSGPLGAFGGQPAVWKDNIDKAAAELESGASGSTPSSTPSQSSSSKSSSSSASSSSSS
jgi:hypothetical protein